MLWKPIKYLENLTGRKKHRFSKEDLEAAEVFIQRIREEKTLEGLLQIRKDIANYIEAHPSVQNNAVEWLKGYNEMLYMHILCFDGAEEELGLNRTIVHE